MASQVKAEFVSKTEFPPYALACVGDRYVIVGGGGGAAKTGIKNQFDVYQLYHNGKQTTGRRVLSYDVGEYCIGNLAAWVEEPSVAPETAKSNSRGHTTPCPTINLAIGKEESCMVLRLTPRLVADQQHQEERIPQRPPADGDDDQVAVRRRGGGGQPHAPQNIKNGLKPGHSGGSSSKKPGKILPDNAYYSFAVTHLCTFTTTFQQDSSTAAVTPGRPSFPEDVYQKAVRVSRDGRRLVTAGTDGAIRVWQVPNAWLGQPVLLKTIAAHAGAVDQLDLAPHLNQVVSVCKTTRECCVWDCGSGKKVIQLALLTPAVKYKFAWARYGRVEDRAKEARLFTVSNPVAGSKNPGIVVSWCGRKYTELRRQTLPGVLSNLAVTDDGRYLATGTMDGDVIIMVAFSLQVLQRLNAAHSMFVTGVEWLPGGSRTSCIVRGFSDASLLTVSCDNSLQITHVPAVTMLPIWVVAVFVAVVLIATFVFASYIGL